MKFWWLLGLVNGKTLLDECIRVRRSDCVESCVDIVAHCSNVACVRDAVSTACGQEPVDVAVELAWEVLQCEERFKQEHPKCAAFCEAIADSLDCAGGELQNCVWNRCSEIFIQTAEVDIKKMVSPLQSERSLPWMSSAVEQCAGARGRSALYSGGCRLNCWFLAKQGGHLCDHHVQTLTQFVACFNDIFGADCSL
eukprot:Gregarina_sp_Poly_1__7560@NODE_422_length_8655_cov_206_021076_g344_i0_p5_GENE_NODE_422_length_8655_cov_206_021076_g344_i0NODE_422_length_8655_cov_206_021076_g344_i0_p5_ORF_typecomplete_len196_score28_30DUF4404/PF14357_6/0_26_NODE_422_length_8655_cov_206_021076_g344_i026083195